MEFKYKDINVYYEIIGDGKPVIMLHGYCADGRLMKGCMEPIFSKRKGYKRIYIDLPCMGQSEHSETIDSSDTFLDFTTEFINNVIPGENFLIAGQSFGGYLARGIVYKMKERVDGVLMICPVIVPKYKKRDVPAHKVLIRDQKLLDSLPTDDAKKFDNTAVIENEQIYKRYKAEVASGLDLAYYPILTYIKRNTYDFTFNVENKEKGHFDKPALILLGRQDSCVGYKDAMKIIENYPRATIAILDKAGHNLQIEQEQLFNLHVNKWISSVEKYCKNQ